MGKIYNVSCNHNIPGVVTPPAIDDSAVTHKENVKYVVICVVTTPKNIETTEVEFVSPYADSRFPFDVNLSKRSNYFPPGYMYSVKVYEEQYLHVTDRCHAGTCSCVYYLDYIPTLLKPCRFAAQLSHYELLSLEDMFVLTGICQGFKIVDKDVTLSYSRSNYKSILTGDMYEQMCKTINDELQSGQISQLSTPATCVHALGAVIRPDGRLRPITDCSRPNISINDHMVETASKFKFSHIEDTRSMIYPQGYGGVVDISNAYRSVLIYPPHRKFVGFHWEKEGKSFHFGDNALCFGLKSAPSIFNSISSLVVRLMEASGVPCIGYLDDYFISGPTRQVCENNQFILIELLKYLGFVINSRKVVTPSQEPKYLGVVIDLVVMVFRLPKEKIDKTMQKVTSILESKWCSRKSLERVTGLLAHCAVLVRGGRTFCRRLYSLLKATSNKQRIRLAEVFRQDLLWWKSFLHVFDGTCPIFPPLIPAHHFFTDASGSGFGAWHLDDFIFGFWGPHGYNCEHVCPPPTFDELSHSNINVKELWPVIASVWRWGEKWIDSTVLVSSDNTQVVNMIISGRSRNPQAMCLLRELFWCCSVYRIDLRARYINTDDNVFADKLSRIPPRRYCKLKFGMPLKFGICCSQSRSKT